MKLRKADYYDYNLVAVILLLVGFGLVMLYSTSAYTAEITQGNDMYFFRRQAIISVGAIVAALIISLVDYHILAKFSIPLYSAAAILMLMVHFFGITHNGAKRWLKIGIEFQPAEIAKIAVIVAVPAIIVWQKEWFNSFSGTCLPIGAGGLLALFAYVFTDNLSTAVIIFAIACVIVFVAHPKTVPFLIIVAVGAVLVGILVFFLWRLDSSGGHFRLQRILVWQNPEKYIASGGYQIMQALYAIGSGGVFGKGLGNSAQKLGWLPDHMRGIRYFRRRDRDRALHFHAVSADVHRAERSRQVRGADGDRHFRAPCAAGRPQYLRCSESDPDDRRHASFHKLRRHVRALPHDGNGHRPLRIPHDQVQAAGEGSVGRFGPYREI